ncbi:ABC transporter [Knoellia sinensis KCTC 19936]|uniref:ABC transporter n=1 Tax=Knoellia sinensis KCTC 19936 TaxID=1385520 RepID=A0A0A0JBJ0_9MICO|nr:dynamin family protein [Knoellia sinensis]KGN34785.1 ABC transporter [Knoellia sinensis KCTC 19936]
MATSDATQTSNLVEAVSGLRDAVEASVLPLKTPGQAQGLTVRKELLDQLDDYVLPRLRSIDAPLLAVVGGSTGAGKSTLVNSLVGASVSRSGVLRPTTTSPVLVHHPEDKRWFSDQRILPSLARVTGGPGQESQPGTVRLVESDALPSGMALLDAPDIDSVVQANRELAGQLLSAADLWVFVTTAARYADAVPWDLLRTAAERGTAVAIVLDRIAPEAVDEIRPHLAGMLREQGLPTAPIFTVPESVLTDDGFLPDESMGRLKSWLDALASDARARAVVVSQTLKGAMGSLSGRTASLAEATAEQDLASAALAKAAADNYEHAITGVKDGMTDGTLLRGEVLARWQEFVGTGEFFRQVESTLSKWRDKLTARLKGQPAPSEDLGEALQSGVANLLVSHAHAAAADTAREWRRLPGGDALVAAHPELVKSSADLGPRVEALVRQWQGEVFDIVRQEGGNRRTNARIAAYGVNAIGLFLMLVSFAATGGLTGAEVGIAGGTSVLAQRVLEAIFGDQAVREMAAKARESLLGHVRDLFAEEEHRYAAAVASVGDTEGQSASLDAAAARVREVAA